MDAYWRLHHESVIIIIVVDVVGRCGDNNGYNAKYLRYTRNYKIVM